MVYNLGVNLRYRKTKGDSYARSETYNRKSRTRKGKAR